MSALSDERGVSMLWFVFGGIILSVVLLPVFLAERWCRRHRQKKYFPVPRGMGWLQRTAVWMLYHLPESVRQSELLNGCADAAAGKLYPGVRREVFCRKHQIKKLMLFYGGITAAIIILFLYTLMNSPSDITDYRIQREDAWGESRNVTLEANIEGEEDQQEIVLTINPRKYTEEERDVLIGRVKDYIDQILPGDNISLQQVDSALVFPESYPEGNVTIEWQPEDYNLIHQDGSLGDLSMYQLPADSTVTAIIRYDRFSFSYEKKVKIVGIRKTEKELLTDKLKEAVAAADEASSEKLQLELPAKVDGRRVEWDYQRNSLLPVMVLSAVIFIILLPLYQEEKLKHQMESRTEQLLCDYPGFVYRMVLMLGAGMTVRKSWDQLIKDYEREERTNGTDTWLYKELKYARIRIQTGVPEIQVYLDFGRRTELPQYMKFSQLLLQYIRRGNREMQELMLQEVSEAEKQRRDLAIRLGETAGTKLLLPMMMLLILVLMIVIVPAFLAM